MTTPCPICDEPSCDDDACPSCLLIAVLLDNSEEGFAKLEADLERLKSGAPNE